MHPHGNTTRSTSKRLAIVARVSTADQEQYGTSLEDQIAKGRLLAQLHDYTIDDRPYQEGGSIYSGDESGRLTLTQRPILSRMLDDARAHKFDAICFYKLDRMARRLKYILDIWDRLDEIGTTVLIVDPMIDTSTPVGRLIRNVLGAVAEFEVDTTLERTQGGIKRRIQRRPDGSPADGWLSGRHYGYRYEKAAHAAGRSARIVVHDEEAEVIRSIFARRIQGLSYERIAKELTAARIPTPTDGAVWNLTTVANILANPCYKGEGGWGRREYLRHPKTGKRTCRKGSSLTRPPSGIVLRYPVIVDPATWHAAQEMTRSAGGRGARPARASVEKFLLRAGMVRCGEHGGRVMSGVSGGPPNKLTYYRCNRQMSGTQADRLTHSIPARPLEDAVWNDVMAFLLDPKRGMAHARRLAAEAASRLEELTAQREKVAARLPKLDDEEAELLRLARRRTIRPEALDAQLQEVESDRAGIRDQLAALDAQIALAQEDVPLAGDIERVCHDLVDGAAYATPQEKRDLLDALHVSVTVHGHDYEITGIVPALTLTGRLPAKAVRNTNGFTDQQAGHGDEDTSQNRVETCMPLGRR